MSSAISRPCSAAFATSRRKSSSVPSSGRIAVWPPSFGADGPRAADVAGPRPPARCCGPCAARGRSDGSAGNTTRRNRARRRTAGAPRHRGTCRGGRVAARSSEETARTNCCGARARDRPTAAARWGTSSAGGGRGGWRRCGRAFRRAPMPSAHRRSPTRPAAASRSFAAQSASALRSAPRARPAASSISIAPTCAATRMSSASTRRCSSTRHDSKWSTQAVTV